MKKPFAALIRSAREARGESQATVARRLRFDRQAISLVEKGRASFTRMLDCCRALGLEVRLTVGKKTLTLVHAMDPDERAEIEANIDWFSRLKPLDRLRVHDIHRKADEILRKAASRGR